MQVERSFRYQFEDGQWITKLGLGALISLVPILNLAIVGYMVGIIRNVASHASEPLPNWDDLGNKFREGLILTAAGLVYAIPFLIVVWLPLGVLAASGVLSQSSSQRQIAPYIGGFGGALLACVMLFLVLYALVLSVIRPIIMILFSRDGTFASCFRLREVARILQLQPRPFFATWIVVILAALGIAVIVGFINFVLGWIPCLGWAVGIVLAVGTTVYLMTVDAHLFGQFRITALGSEG